MDIYGIIRARIAHYADENDGIQKEINRLSADAHSAKDFSGRLAAIHGLYERMTQNCTILSELNALLVLEANLKLVA